MWRTQRGVFAVLAASTLVATAACADDGNGGGSTGDIVLGATAAHSGPAAASYNVVSGMQAYFDQVNADGGINGRKIKLIGKDDAYDPSKALSATRQLVEQDHVVAMVGSVGTGSQLAVRPYLNSKKIPQLFVVSGDPSFATEQDKYPWTFGWQPSYLLEGRVMADYVLKNLPDARIGVLYQNDNTGKPYLQGLTDGLGAHASQIVATEGYHSTAASVSSQIASLKASGANTLFVATSPGFGIKAMVAAANIGWYPQLLLDSLTNDAPSMKTVAGQAGTDKATEGALSVQFLKDPTAADADSDPALQRYHQIMDKYCSGCDASDRRFLHGMALGYAIVDVLKSIDGDITSQSIRDAARSLNEPDNPFLVPGIAVRTGPGDPFPIDQLSMERYHDGAWELIGDVVTGKSA